MKNTELQISLFLIVQVLLLDNNTTCSAQVTVKPMSVIQAEGLEAVFECQYPTAEGYGWSINGTRLTNINTPPGVGGFGTEMLTIPGNVTYNNSVIRCRAFTQSGILNSQNATLQFIGVVINTVTNGVDTITLSWDDPFTTNITYCVEAVQTVSSSETVLSECGLTGTQYTFTYPDHGPCDRFNFTVTPTEGGRNGTSSEPESGFFMLATSTGGNTAVRVGQNENEKDITFIGSVPSCFNFTSYEVNSDILPEIITGSLSSLPLTFSLPTDNMTNITVTLTDATGVDLVFENMLISTHDIQDLIMETCTLPNCMGVTVVYAQGSLSPGALIVIVPVLPDNSLDYTNVILPQNLSQNVNITVPTGSYKVFAFDLESNGVPRIPISMAADIEIAEVTSGVTTNPSILDPALSISAYKSSNGDVTVTCSNASLNCLVLIQSAGDLDQLVVGLINTTDDRTVVLSPGATGDVSVVVFTWTSGDSFFNGQVSVVSRFQALPPSTLATTSATTAESETTGSGSSLDPTFPVQTLSSGVVAGIIIILLMLLLSVVVVFIVIAICFVKRQKDTQTEQTDVPMVDGRVDWSTTFAGIEQPNEAYSVVLKKNVAYEKTKKPRRQRNNQSQAQPPLPPGGVEETNQGERVYENTVPAEVVHEYEEVLPQGGVRNANYVNLEVLTENLFPEHKL